MLGIEDHGIFTFNLTLDYGDGGQGAGNYGIDKPYGIALIRKILNTVGVDKWEDLKGEHIRAQCSHTKVHAIGHFIDDKWLNFEDFINDNLKPKP